MDISIPRGDTDSITVVLNDVTTGTEIAQNLAGYKILTTVKRNNTDPDEDAVIPLKTENIPAVVTSGTGTISSSGVTVTGVGTAFLTQLNVGDTITASGQTRTITAITLNTSLTTDTAFSPVLAGAAFTYILGVYEYVISYTKTETDIAPGAYVSDFRFIDANGEVTTPPYEFTFNILSNVTRQNS